MAQLPASVIAFRGKGKWLRIHAVVAFIADKNALRLLAAPLTSKHTLTFQLNKVVRILRCHYKVFRNNPKAPNLKRNFIMIRLDCNYNLIILYIFNRWQDSSLSFPGYNTLGVFSSCKKFNLKLCVTL